MIYKFRIIVDVEEDIFRDIEIYADATLQDFHSIITQAFDFDGREMASFYMSDETWNQGEEISLFDISDDDNTASKLMHKTKLSDVVIKPNDKLIYVYDFLKMWTFYVTLIKIGEKESEKIYPNVLFAHGKLPNNAPEKLFEITDNSSDDFNDNTDINSYDDLDFNENWN